jgi:transposase InsO family protein
MKQVRQKRLPLDPTQEKLLHHIYYDKRFFFGRDKIWRLPEVQEAGVSRRQVGDWLALQQTAQMFKPTRASRDVQPTIATKPYGQIGVDLVDMTTMAENGYKWLLTGVDLFTKKAFAVPMKDKTEKSVTDAMRKMIKQFAKMPSVIRSDNGSEFICEGFRKLLADNNIKQVLSSAGKPQSNGEVERINGILKRLFKMNYLYSGKSDWMSNLDQYLSNYNNSYQRIIGMNPNEAEQAGADGDYEVVHERIKQNVIKRHVKIQIG